MSKYPPGESIVRAVYDNAPADNPFLAAMPVMLSQGDFNYAIRSFPKLPANLPTMTNEERRQSLTLSVLASEMPKIESPLKAG